MPAQKETLQPAEIFERCAKAHLGGRSEVNVEDFRLSFELVVQEANKNIQFRASHFFKSPWLVKTTLDDPDYKVRVDTGFDGKSYWLQEQNKSVILLTAKEHSKDIREIDERIRLSKVLANTFSIQRFMHDLENPKRLPDTQILVGKEPAKRIAVQTRARNLFLVKSAKNYDSLDAILYFDPESFLLRELYLSPPPSDNPKEQTDESERVFLDDHQEVKGILVPHRIQIFSGKETKKPAYQITIGEIDFNLGLKEEEFKR